MKLLIVRHGDPNYELDTLTPTGWKEAEFLSVRLATLDIKAFYVSPLGRAKDTASVTLKKLDRTAEERLWLREFSASIKRPDKDEKSIAWDWLPQDWTKEPRFFDFDLWHTVETMANADIHSEIKWVYDGIDELLAKHGYIRENEYYRAAQPNEDTVVLFCHFGVECVILSHLLHISPMLLWHGTCAAPTSVTTLTTEERREGIAYFRMNSFGDISHLYANCAAPSFSARFCETFNNPDQRKD